MCLKSRSQVFVVGRTNEFRECTKTPWGSIYISGLIAFCTITQFAMFFSSMWPYLQTLDPDITEPFYGYIVGAYSVGSILTSQLFSRWSAKTRSVTYPLIACMFSMAMGNLIYTLVPLASVPTRKWVMLGGRFVLGFGDNALSLLQGYASTASTAEDRSRAIAIMTCGLAIGFAFGPSIQVLFAPIGIDGWQIVADLRVNMYSAPAVFSMFVSILAMLMLKCCFVERYAGIKKKVDEKNQNLPPPDKLALGLCFVGRFAQFFTFVNLEAIGAAYVETFFAMPKEDVVTFIAFSHIACGCLSFLLYAGYIFGNLEKLINARIAVIASYVMFTVFYLITFSWPFVPGQISMYTEKDLAAFLNGSMHEEPLGCNMDRISWCEAMAPQNKWIYFFGFVLFIGLGWPNINVCLSTMLSKIIGPRHQAYYQGIFQVCASSARLTGPIVMSAIYRSSGPRWVWGIEIVGLSLLAVVLSVCYNRLVPLEVAQQRKETKAGIVESNSGPPEIEIS